MKALDIERIHEAGLITHRQRLAIIDHFKLDREGNRFLAIVASVGAVLVSAGIILLISANWENIPRFAKLAGALALLVGAHAGGWILGRGGDHPRAVEALHLIGSGMFLANIALVGQIYHLTSRPPNAILLWLLGIAALPWILRSKAQWILSLAALGLWLGLELNQRDSWLYFDGEARQFIVYAILGVFFASAGLLFSKTAFPEFGPATEKFGLLALHLASYPLTLGIFYSAEKAAPTAWILTAVLTAAAAVLVVQAGLRLEIIPDLQWRWVWAAAQLGVLLLGWWGLTTGVERIWHWNESLVGPHWVATPALFFFCLLQAQVGLVRRSVWLVNLAMVFMGAHILTAYFQLFGSMQTTGLMFVVTGIFLIALAISLERKRRSLLKRMAAPLEEDPN